MDHAARGIVPLVMLVVLALLTGGAAAAGDGTSSVACPHDSGHPPLGLDGFSVELEAPVAVGGAPTATAGVEWAHLPLQADLAPSAAAEAIVEVGWFGVGHDFDAYLYRHDGAGWALLDGAGGISNPQRVSATVSHCDVLMLSVRALQGGADVELGITASLTAAGTSLACAPDDPAPGCAGKEAGTSPDPVEDARSILYLTAPAAGQVSSAAAAAGAGGETLTGVRPRDRRPDAVALLAAPGQGGEHHASAASFSTSFAGPRSIAGQASAFLYVAAPRGVDDAQVIRARLWGDGTLLAEATHPAPTARACASCPTGSRPVGVHVPLPVPDGAVASRVTLQVLPEPVGAGGSPSATVLFGSVSFPSRVTLPAPG